MEQHGRTENAFAERAFAERVVAENVVVEKASAETVVRLTAFVHGQVQGVGFRWWTRARALEIGLVGNATNLPDGRVQVVAEGTRRQCAQLIAQLRGGHTPGSVVLVVEHYGQPRGERGFLER
jgi:acylphosphatase